MRIILYTCSAEKNRLDKTNFISNEFRMEGSLKKESSISNPIIIVKKTNPVTFRYNYMYIPEFNRYYYILDYVSLVSDIWEIYARVDVLYSFRSDIRDTLVIVDKTQSFDDSNLYYNDSSFVLDSRSYISTLKFPYGFNDNSNNILICAGGSQ